MSDIPVPPVDFEIKDNKYGSALSSHTGSNKIFITTEKSERA